MIQWWHANTNAIQNHTELIYGFNLKPQRRFKIWFILQRFAVLCVPVIAELWTHWQIIQPNNKVNDFDLHFTIVEDQEELFMRSADGMWNGGHT